MSWKKVTTKIYERKSREKINTFIHYLDGDNYFSL